MKYRVHVYVTYRIPVEVEADSHEAAMKAAAASFNPDDFTRGDGFEYADEISGYLVDEDGDEDFRNSRSYDNKRQPSVRINGIFE